MNLPRTAESDEHRERAQRIAELPADSNERAQNNRGRSLLGPDRRVGTGACPGLGSGYLFNYRLFAETNPAPSQRPSFVGSSRQLPPLNSWHRHATSRNVTPGAFRGRHAA